MDVGGIKRILIKDLDDYNQSLDDYYKTINKFSSGFKGEGCPQQNIEQSKF